MEEELTILCSTAQKWREKVILYGKKNISKGEEKTTKEAEYGRQ